MSKEEFLKKSEEKKAIEEYLHDNLETIAGSHLMVNLIQEYLNEKDEEKKKRIFNEIISPNVIENQFQKKN